MSTSKTLGKTFDMDHLLKKVEQIVDGQINDLVNYSHNTNTHLMREGVSQNNLCNPDSGRVGGNTGIKIPQHSLSEKTSFFKRFDDEDQMVVSHLAERLKRDIAQAVDDFSQGLYQQLKVATRKIEEETRSRVAEGKVREEQYLIRTRMESFITPSSTPSETPLSHEGESIPTNISQSTPPSEISSSENSAPRIEEQRDSLPPLPENKAADEEPATTPLNSYAEQQPPPQILDTGDLGSEDFPSEPASEENVEFTQAPPGESVSREEATSDSFLEPNYETQEEHPPLEQTATFEAAAPEDSAPVLSPEGNTECPPARTVEDIPREEMGFASLFNMDEGETNKQQSPEQILDPGNSPFENTLSNPISEENTDFLSTSSSDEAPKDDEGFSSLFDIDLGDNQ